MRENEKPEEIFDRYVGLELLDPVAEPRPSIPGRAPERETWDWAAVVARHTRDDWPPPEWLVAEDGCDPYEAPAAEEPKPLAA